MRYLRFENGFGHLERSLKSAEVTKFKNIVMTKTVHKICTDYGGKLVEKPQKGDLVLSLLKKKNQVTESYVFSSEMDRDFVAYKSDDFTKALEKEGYALQCGVFTK